MTIFGCWDCAKAELPNAHPANNKGKTNFFTACEGQFLSLIWDLNRVRCLAVRLTNAIALAVRNIAVIRISVFILDFSFFTLSKRKMRPELQKKVRELEKNWDELLLLRFDAAPNGCQKRPKATRIK